MNAPTMRKGFAPGTIIVSYGWAVSPDDGRLHAIETTYRKREDGRGSDRLSSHMTAQTFKNAREADAWSLAENTREGDAKCVMVPLS